MCVKWVISVFCFIISSIFILNNCSCFFFSFSRVVLPCSVEEASNLFLFFTPPQLTLKYFSSVQHHNTHINPSVLNSSVTSSIWSEQQGQDKACHACRTRSPSGNIWVSCSSERSNLDACLIDLFLYFVFRMPLIRCMRRIVRSPFAAWKLSSRLFLNDLSCRCLRMWCKDPLSEKHTLGLCSKTSELPAVHVMAS